jgi:phage protein D
MNIGAAALGALSVFNKPAATGRVILVYTPKGAGSAGTDITSIIAHNMIEFTYKDYLSFHNDPIEIILADPDRRFSTEWVFDIGGRLAVTLEQDNWGTIGTTQIQLGNFFIDEIQIDGPPNVVHVRATTYDPAVILKWQPNTTRMEASQPANAPAGSFLLQEPATGTGTTLKDFAAKVAKEGNYQLQYIAPINPAINTIGQTEVSDFVALEKHCRSFNLICKPSKNILFIADELQLEGLAPSYSIIAPTSKVAGGINNGGIEHWSLVVNVQDTYTAAVLKKLNPNTGSVTTATYTDPNSNSGTALKNTKATTVPAGTSDAIPLTGPDTTTGDPTANNPFGTLT